ncbi:MAG: NAD(P)-dependent oxidoreductase [Acidimicrobiales bacterium]|jgi:nucleoside-diphosphate-sugar epimerase|nr:NAD(P)-dependent oxidoreductase [Acidimicrobiales bacterium]
MSLTDSTILLAGCTGQVGKVVAKALAAQGNEVHGLARFKDSAVREEMEAAGVTCHAVDLIDPDLSSVPTGPDHLINLAVTKTGRWDKDLAANADAAGLLMQHCREAKSAIHCSSTAVYAPTGGEPMSEDSPLGQDHHQYMMPTYSTVKTAAESVASFAAKAFDLPTTIARLCVPYGHEGGWPIFHLMMAQGGQPIPVHTDGSRYNVIHHEDIIGQIPALLDAATTPATILNWGGDEVVSVEEWTRYMCDIAGAPEPTFEPTDFTIPSAVIDTTKSRPVLGPPTVGWQDGFRRLVEALS